MVLRLTWIFQNAILQPWPKPLLSVHQTSTWCPSHEIHAHGFIICWMGTTHSADAYHCVTVWCLFAPWAHYYTHAILQCRW